MDDTVNTVRKADAFAFKELEGAYVVTPCLISCS
jgi:hypothetical protein